MGYGRVIFSKHKRLINFGYLMFRFTPSMARSLAGVVFGRSRIGLLLRYFQLKLATMKCGDNIYIAQHVVLRNVQNLSVGSNVSIHEFGYIDAVGGINIGDNVSIAHGCSIVSFEHTWSDKSEPIKYNDIRQKSITISDDVWIGCGVRILAGSRIGSRVVVAAGAVVRGELESGYLYAGVPARKIKCLA